MTIARNLVLWLLAPICVVLSIAAVMRIQREHELFESDIRHDQVLFARGLSTALHAVWLSRGVEAAAQLVREADPPSAEVDIHWIALDERSPGERWVGDPSIRARLVAGEIVHTLEMNGAEERLDTFFPLAPREGQRTALMLTESLQPKTGYLRQSVRTSILTTLAIVGLCALVAGLVGRLVVGLPMQRLVEQARRIGRGDLAARVEPMRRDEIGALATEMNAMAERLADAQRRTEDETAARITAIEQLRQADRLATVGRLASGVAHELGTPLNVVSGRATMIADREVEGDKARAYAEIIVREVDRMSTIIRGLLDFGRQRQPERAEQGLPPIVEQVFSLVRPIADKARVRLSMDATNAKPVSIDAGQIQQVVTNLVVNGIHAMPEGGPLNIWFENSPEAVTMVVQDRGVGVSEENRSKIFEPFFSTKRIGEGTGLGLSISYGIIRDHGGSIDVESEVGVGTTFRVHLPVRS